MITVYLEDHGQDFLEWDIEKGTVVACRPLSLEISSRLLRGASGPHLITRS